jgi:23S rRNA G2445 N2-methylase RlmL
MKITLSPLGHTWILDLDGTIVKHNGYKLDDRDTLLLGALEFMNNIPDEDMVVFITSRSCDCKEITEDFLKQNHIRFDHIIYNAPYGERILVNDCKPSGLEMALSLAVERDVGVKNLAFEIDRSL